MINYGPAVLAGTVLGVGVAAPTYAIHKLNHEGRPSTAAESAAIGTAPWAALGTGAGYLAAHINTEMYTPRFHWVRPALMGAAIFAAGGAVGGLALHGVTKP